MNDDHFYDDISPLTVRDETNFTGPKVPNFMAVKIGYISDIHIDDKVGYKYEPDRKRYTKFVAKKTNGGCQKRWAKPHPFSW
jgi:hypothetical protein